jgi:hypothetical protein
VDANSKDGGYVVRRGLSEPDSLDPDEHVQFFFLFSMFVDQASCALDEYNLGVTKKSVLEISCQPILNMLRTPGGAKYWKSRSYGFRPEFQEYVNRELADSKG